MKHFLTTALFFSLISVTPQVFGNDCGTSALTTSFKDHFVLFRCSSTTIVNGIASAPPLNFRTEVVIMRTPSGGFAAWVQDTSIEGGLTESSHLFEVAPATERHFAIKLSNLGYIQESQAVPLSWQLKPRFHAGYVRTMPQPSDISERYYPTRFSIFLERSATNPRFWKALVDFTYYFSGRQRRLSENVLMDCIHEGFSPQLLGL